jgi:hypothetical protein
MYGQTVSVNTNKGYGVIETADNKSYVYFINPDTPKAVGVHVNFDLDQRSTHDIAINVKEA